MAPSSGPSREVQYPSIPDTKQLQNVLSPAQEANIEAVINGAQSAQRLQQEQYQQHHVAVAHKFGVSPPELNPQGQQGIELPFLKVDPIKDAARDKVMRGLSDAERETLKEEKENYAMKMRLFGGGGGYFPDGAAPSPGPLTQEIERRVEKAALDARGSVYNAMSPEAKNALATELRGRDNETRITGTDPGKGPLEKAFEDAVINKLQETAVDPKVAEREKKHEELYQKLRQQLNSLLQGANEAKELMSDAGKFQSSIEQLLRDPKAVDSKATLEAGLAEYGDKLEKFAAKTNSKEILETVKMIRELNLRGLDFSDPAVIELGRKLSSNLSVVDSEIAMAHRAHYKSLVERVAQQEREAAGQEAYRDSMRVGLEATGVELDEGQGSRTKLPQMKDSVHHQKLWETIEEGMLTK